MPLPLSFDKRLLLTQLTALWALSEAVLGGALHGTRLPVTGLILGGTAVLLICLMGYYGNRRGEILKATLVVCFIKMTLAPHTPFPAYFAVLFQGMVGSLLMSGQRFFAVRCVVFGILALLESALQKLLMLTLVFGVEFWKAVGEFVSKLATSTGRERRAVCPIHRGRLSGLACAGRNWDRGFC